MTEMSFSDPLGGSVHFELRGGRLTRVSCDRWTVPEFDVDEGALLCLAYGDLHGRIQDALSLADGVRRTLGVPLHGYLQVGDLGAFDEQSVLDVTTRRLARKDPAVLGFKSIRAMDLQQLDQLLSAGQTFVPRFLFVEGNHDDLQYLQERYPLEALSYSLVFVESGETAGVSSGHLDLTVGGIGWSSARGDLRRLAAAQPRIVLAHAIEQVEEWSDFHREEEAVCLFGHASQAHRLSQPMRRWFGLEHFHVGRAGLVREGSWGLLIANSERVEFTYLPASLDG